MGGLTAGLLAHAWDLAFPAGGSAPWNRGVFLAAGFAATEEDAKSGEQKEQERFLEGVHR